MYFKRKPQKAKAWQWTGCTLKHMKEFCKAAGIPLSNTVLTHDGSLRISHEEVNGCIHFTNIPPEAYFVREVNKDAKEEISVYTKQRFEHDFEPDLEQSLDIDMP